MARRAGRRGRRQQQDLQPGLPNSAGTVRTLLRCGIPGVEGGWVWCWGRGPKATSLVLSGRPLYVIGGLQGRDE